MGDFWRLWTATTVSSLGDGVRLAALPLLAARLSHDPRVVALVTAAQGLAWLVFGLPAGALADRWDRRRTMVGCDTVRCGLALALMAAVGTGRASIPLLMAAAFGLEVAETLFYGAAQAAIPALLPRAGLERANGWLMASTVLGKGFVGPPAGAALFVGAAALPFTVDAGSFALAALLAVRIRTDLAPPPAAPGARSLAGEVREGLTWLWRHSELRTAIILLTVWNLVESAVFAVLVLWSLEELRLPESGYGLLIAALALGGVAGSLLADRVGRRLGTGRAIGVAVVLTVTAYGGLALTRTPAVAFALMAVIGLAAFVWNVLTAAFRQAVVPDPLQGRVGSAYRFATWGFVAPGAMLGGLSAQLWGLHAPFWLAAGVLAAVAAATLPRLGNSRLAAARAAAEPR